MAAEYTPNLPILQFGEENNLYEFRGAMVSEALLRFGEEGQILKTLVPTVFTRLSDAILIQCGATEEDLPALRLESVREAVRMRAKAFSDRTRMFAFMWKHLSLASQNAIKKKQEFATMETASDALWLWKSILITHYPGAAMGTVAEQMDASDNFFSTMVMGPMEEIIQFKERFDFNRKCRVLMSNVDLSDEAAALAFLRKLDDVRYHKFRERIRYDLRTNLYPQGFSLSKIFELACAAQVDAVHQYAPAGVFASNMVHSKSYATSVASKPEKSYPASKTNFKGAKQFSTEEWKKMTPTQKLAYKTCRLCKIKGHYENKCPYIAEIEKLAAKANVHATSGNPAESDLDDENFGGGGVVFVNQKDKYSHNYEVLLDNQANISIIHKNLLTEVSKSSNPVDVSGIGGVNLHLTRSGNLFNFFKCYTHEDAQANVLCFADVRDKYPTSYDETNDQFIVKLPNTKLAFTRKGKLYGADMSAWAKSQALNSVASSTKYSAKEFQMARLAYDFRANAGFPSHEQAMRLTSGGDIRDIPFSTRDMQRSYDIFGEHPARLKVTMEDRQVGLAPIETPAYHPQTQTLYMDIVNIESQDFLITVAHPLNLTIVSLVKKLDAATIGHNLTDHIALLRAERYDVSEVIADRAAAFNVLVGKYQNVAIRLGGAGDHVPRADERCKAIKKIYRSVRSDLPWDLPKSFVSELVSYCAHRLNMFKSRQAEVPPKVEINGFKPHFDKEYSLKFGDYAEVRDPGVTSNNAAASRSRSCIALYPAGNRQGSWHFFNMETRRNITSSRWSKQKTSSVIVDRMNSIAKAELDQKKLRKHDPSSESTNPTKRQLEINNSGKNQKEESGEKDEEKTTRSKFESDSASTIPVTIPNYFNVPVDLDIKSDKRSIPILPLSVSKADYYPIELIAAHNKIQYESTDSLLPAPTIAQSASLSSEISLTSAPTPTAPAILPAEEPNAIVVPNVPAVAEALRLPMGGRYEQRLRKQPDRYFGELIPSKSDPVPSSS